MATWAQRSAGDPAPIDKNAPRHSRDHLRSPQPSGDAPRQGEQTHHKPPLHPQSPPFVARQARRQGGPPPSASPREHRIGVRRQAVEEKHDHYCCSLRCCCCWFWLVLIFLLAIAAVALYLVFRGKSPSYTVSSLSIRGLHLNSTTPFVDRTFSPAIDGHIRATNPNAVMGVYYLGGSSINIYFGGIPLCNGPWAAFYHRPKNETLVYVKLTGRDVKLPAAVQRKMSDGEKKKKVPLEVEVKVPMKIRVGQLKLWKMTAKVWCDVKVDKLSPAAKVVEETCSAKVDVV